MTSEFVKVRDAIEGFVEHLWNTKGVQDTVKTTEAAAITVGKQALTAGVVAGIAAAQAPNANRTDTAKAVEAAALGSVETVGVQVGTETLQSIIQNVTEAIHGPADAPNPPAT